MIIKGYFFSLLYGIICLALAFILYKLGVPKKTTRKVVHILIGFEWVILNHYIGSSVHFIAVCLIFLSLLIVAYRKRLMPMISSDGDNAPGTVYYAAAMTVMSIITYFIPSMMYPFGIGVFCTSLGDGLAGVVGQSLPSKINPKIYENKTVFGALANFAVSLLAVIAISAFFDMGITLLGCVAIAALSLELELFTKKGLDNVTITLGTSLLSFGFVNFDAIANYIIPILATPLIIAFAIKRNALTADGVIAAIILDVIISVSLGNFGFVILLSFFVLGIVTDKIKKNAEKREQNGEIVKKRHGETRNCTQVLCNGAVGACASFLYLVTGERLFLISFLASFAEALSDTSASGIGALSKTAFDVFRMKRCDKGLSGGVSLVGTVASLVGSSVIAVIAVSFGVIDIGEALIVSLCGFLGCVFDTLLGSLVQVKYLCSKCGKIVEKRNHCGETTVYYRGVKFIDNSAVNFLGTLFSALLVIFFVL